MSYRIVADEANENFIIVQPKDIDLYLDGETVEEAISKYAYWLKNNVDYLIDRLTMLVDKEDAFAEWRDKFEEQSNEQ